MKELLQKLYENGNQLLGEGYDKSLAEINKTLPFPGMSILEFPSGTEVGMWTVPDEWMVREAWVKFKGEKIIEYTKENPLALMVYAEPFKGVVNKEELLKHLYYSDDMPEHVPYEFTFYKKKWGFGVKKELIFKKKDKVCEPGMVCPVEFTQEVGLEEGDYEVFIDTEFKKGIMKVGVYTIPGKSKKEILLFAHLDHPYQANDNLSGVVTLLEVVKRISAEHTIKIIFCPETIGSIAYAETQDISKVDFVIALECVGTGNDLLIQKSYDKYARINYAAHLAVHELGVSYMKGVFRQLIGSDEYYFNDPLVGIPGIMLSRWAKPNFESYPEYHTSADTPEIIKPEMIEQTAKVILKIIEIMEKDFIPVRTQKGVLFRMKFGIQSAHKSTNRDLDYLWYDSDGKKYLSEIVLPLGITYSMAYEVMEKLIEKGAIKKYDPKTKSRKTRKKKGMSIME